MKSYSLQQLAEAIGGSLPHGGHEVSITSGVSTDTRKVRQGSLFIALKGDQFDGHCFVSEAKEKGALAAIVHEQSQAPDSFPVILVQDTLKGLQALAHWYRRQLNIPVVAISGSNGKTSTKDFTRSVLSKRYRVNATEGNLNNHIGLPLTILAAEEQDEVMVVEMGMNHAGELEPLCEIARPDISVITNVGTAHIEFLGSQEAIAQEKGTLARALSSEGVLVVPSSCEYLEDFRQDTRGRVIAVGESGIRADRICLGADRSDFDLTVDDLGCVPTSIAVPGYHMITNALLAAGVGIELGLDLTEISQGLQASRLTSGRLRKYECRGVTIIDDTYNANPESMAAALQTAASIPIRGARTAVLGRLAEQGHFASTAYQALGKLARDLGVRLVSIGTDVEALNAPLHFDTIEPAAMWLSENTNSGDLVLFKGSRSAAMERVMNLAYPE